MDEKQIIREFEEAGALLKGHFILSSGLHSDTYIQCARVLLEASRGERLCRELAAKVRKSSEKFDVIVAPAMGGVVVGYEMGRQLSLPSMFCERVDGAFTLRRGFELEKNQRVLIVEDVVTTGKSSMETARCIEAYGAVPIAVASLINRRSKNDVSLTLPLVSLLKVDALTYKAEEVPDSLKAIPAAKPGSRWLAAKT